VVTSAQPGEGKTTTASNLAVTYAQMGMRVLLVDCDLRKPRVDALFGIPRSPGLTEMLVGEAGPGEVIRSFGPVANLDILPSGHIPANPSELLGGRRIREVVDDLRVLYDVILLDAAPLAGGSDGAILGTFSDGVIMVVMAGVTEGRSLEQARRQFHTVNVHWMGVVLNDPKGESERYAQS